MEKKSSMVQTIHKSDLEKKLLSLCDQWLIPQGFRPVDLDCHISGKSLVRIFIEKIAPETISKSSTGATLEDCARISALVGPALDVENVIPGAYDLEISSPGLDRRLRTEEDFRSAIGKRVALKFVQTQEGLGNLAKAILLDLVDGALVLETHAGNRKIPLDKIKKANIIWAPESKEKN